jgi:hypothetical protein
MAHIDRRDRNGTIRYVARYTDPTDRDSISPRFLGPPGWGLPRHRPDVELLRNVDVACNGYES